jgi:hypothetical protein
MNMEQWWTDDYQGKAEETQKMNRSPMPFHPPRILREVIWD